MPLTTTPPAPLAHVERQHARSSPSKLKNLEICPSYESDESQPPHPVTLRGTAMHEALEKSNDSALIEGEHPLVDMCRQFQDSEAELGETVILEPHLKTHDADVKGFADRVVLGPRDAAGRRKARIRDYKMGFNLVDLPDVNPQAVAYVTALFLTYPDVDEINFAFLIPRLDAVLEHTFTRADLPALMLRISTIADRVRRLAGKEFNVCETNCLYCGRKATCPPLHAKVLTIASGLTAEDRLPLPSVFDPDSIVEPKELAYALNMAGIAESWASQVKAFALRFRLELGQEIPGYSLVERSGKREITDPTAAFTVAKEFGVTETEFISAAKVSVTQLDRLVKDHAAQGDKAAATERFVDRLSDANALTRGGSFSVLQRDKKKPKLVVAA